MGSLMQLLTRPQLRSILARRKRDEAMRLPIQVASTDSRCTGVVLRDVRSSFAGAQADTDDTGTLQHYRLDFEIRPTLSSDACIRLSVWPRYAMSKIVCSDISSVELS